MNRRTHSIFWQITGFMVTSIAIVIVLVWLMNNLFLGRVYQSTKIRSMEEVFEILDDAADEGYLYEEEYAPAIERLCANENLSMMVISSDGTVEITSVNENSAMMDQLYDLMLDRRSRHSRVVIANDDYTIQRNLDERTDTDFLTLWGTLDDGNLILLRSALQSMSDSAAISNRFLLWIGLLSLGLGVVLSAMIARHLTRPVYAMTEISKRMTELDFDAKYTPGWNRNELDILGEHLNELSRALGTTILDLKQANTELLRDLKIRDENETMRREFISNVSHELKTPLALIRGYAEGLQEGVFEDEQARREYLEIIIDESEKLSGMVQKLLSLNRLEYGKDQIHMERVDLAALIGASLMAHRLSMEQEGIAVYLLGPQGQERLPAREEDMEWEPLYVYTDPALCEQVIENYLTNAVHYCRDPKQIRIGTAKEGGAVRFSVFNTGDPIPADALPHIWEKFYKVDEARTREYGGSGIGLSIVYAIAEGLHTKCGAANAENGVEFWFDFEA